MSIFEIVDEWHDDTHGRFPDLLQLRITRVLDIDASGARWGPEVLGDGQELQAPIR